MRFTLAQPRYRLRDNSGTIKRLLYYKLESIGLSNLLNSLRYVILSPFLFQTEGRVGEKVLDDLGLGRLLKRLITSTDYF